MQAFDKLSIQQVSVWVKQLNERGFTCSKLYRVLTSAIYVQTDLLIIKINQNMPQISPMGMLEIGAELFPTVIARRIIVSSDTFVTY